MQIVRCFSAKYEIQMQIVQLFRRHVFQIQVKRKKDSRAAWRGIELVKVVMDVRSVFVDNFLVMELKFS